MNKAILIGHIGKDPETIHLESGTTITKFSLATNENYKDKQGNKVEQTEWHNIVVFGKQAEIAEKYFTKGMRIMVEGKIKTDRYEKDGQKRYSTNIILNGFEFLGGNENNSTPKPQPEDYKQLETPPMNEGDELPF